MARRRKNRFGTPPPVGGGSRTTGPLARATGITPRVNAGGTVATRASDNVIHGYVSRMTGKATGSSSRIRQSFVAGLEGKTAGAARRKRRLRGVGSS